MEPNTPLKDGGDALIGSGTNAIVVESHETGIEIIADISTIMVNIGVIVGFVIAILNARVNDKKSNNEKIKIVKKYIRKGKYVEEEVIKIEFPLDKKGITKTWKI
ncbi:MAG: hypothetical protein LHV68_12355 [Elusimicrobia bacterium]|nr:hypothetical protein [Candidatus Liberimonas magnetica]